MIMDEVIARTIVWARLSHGDNLTGFIIDAEYAFEETEAFDSVQIESTEDPARMLVIRLVAHKSVPTLQSIADALREAWLHLAYLGIQALAIEQYRDATVMRFVTATEDGGLCVTGEANATSPVYERLVTEFEQNFSFAGPIKSR